MKGFQVAIDGPGGAGKSTVARLAAEKTGFVYVDTGAMYRAVARHASSNGADLSDEAAVCALLNGIELSTDVSGGSFRIILGGNDITELLRTREAGMGASAVAKHACVRVLLVAMQRELAGSNNVIMDGRDIGTHVLKNAQVKIYLDATVDARTERRVSELKGIGLPADTEAIKNEIILRDYNDQNRAESPLRKADDAVLVDTSGMSADEAVDRVLNIIRMRGGL